MSPADKTKPLKRVTETTLLAPIASRTRQSSQPPVTTTEAPMSTNELFEALKSLLQPQVEDLKKMMAENRSQTDARFTTLEDSVSSMNVDLSSQQQVLENRLTTVMDRLSLVEEENRSLRSCLVPLPSQVQELDSPMIDDLLTVPPLNQGSASSKFATVSVHSSSPVSSPAPPAPPTTSTVLTNPESTNKLRLFTKVSNNQGFTYLYLPLRARVPFKEIRATLKLVPLAPGSIIDIYYPTSKIVALLVHNDYATKARALLKSKGLITIDTFNPFDPSHLADPQYKDASIEERTTQMKIIQDNQMYKTLAFLKHPVKLAVARDFHRKGRLSDAALQDLLQLHQQNATSTPSAPPSLGAFLQDPPNKEDSSMDEEDEDELMDPAPSGSGASATQDSSVVSPGQVSLTIATNSSAGGGEPAHSL